jgi:OmpA-OmpF porin, OOP family
LFSLLFPNDADFKFLGSKSGIGIIELSIGKVRAATACELKKSERQGSTGLRMRRLFKWSAKWWPGVIPLVVLWGLAAWTTTAPLEADLSARSSEALKGIVLDKTGIEVEGRDVTLSADAFSEQGRHNAVAAVEAVPGVRLVNDETRLVPEANPFVWSAERDVVRVTLGGSAPLPASKAKLLDAARADLGGVEVVDQMALARGAPPRFEDAALLLIGQIAKLKDGTFAISDTKVTLSGMARELGGREAIAAALKDLPEGFSVAANDVKAPPYIFQAYKDPVAVTLTLSGYVPDNVVHAAIDAAAERKFFSEKVVDNLKASVGAPSGFAAAVVPALGALSRLSTGTLVVTDREVKLSGDALYDAAAAQIRAGLGKEFPASFHFKPDISIKPASAPVDATVCQQLFSELLGQGKIRFEPGRVNIDPDSAGLLDRLIETALRCPTANIEVGGHTDADGEDAANQALSEKRAQAVVDYVVKAGLPASRFTAVGYGSTQPVGSNDTDEGKAQNRRIEFLVR